MRYLTIILTLITSLCLGQNKLEVRGIYTGENKYVSNPYANDLVHFCTDSVKVNDSVYEIDLNNSAFKIDLKNLKISLGEVVNIIIYHKESCKPMILNSMASPPRASKIKFDSIELDEEGLLSWKCYNDSVGTRAPIKIEQFKFNRWVGVSEINQNWNFENNYSTRVNFSPGINKFRINGYSSISDTICFISTINPVKFNLGTNDMSIVFEDSVSYELQNEIGLRYFRGEGQTVDLTGLRNGNYQLCYDNEIIKFSIKKKKIHWPQ